MVQSRKEAYKKSAKIFPKIHSQTKGAVALSSVPEYATGRHTESTLACAWLLANAAYSPVLGYLLRSNVGL